MEAAETGRRPHSAILALRRKLSAAGRFSLYALNRFNRDGCFAASGALSYTTLVSLVPLGVIAFGILSIYPKFAVLRQELLAFVFRNFVPAVGEQAGWWFEYFAGSAAQATAFGILGIAGTGVLLLITVEDQLNLLWRVTVRRPWGQRVLAYWTLITLGPLLIGASLTLTTYFQIAAQRAGFDTEALAEATSGWLDLAVRLLPFGFEVVACTLLYSLIPNCLVRWRDALLGAIVAAAVIEFEKIGFSFYITSFSSYQTVYGTIASIPIFLLWMYVSWMAVLLGAVVAANLPTWRVDERLSHLSAGGVRLGFSIALIAALARAQRRGTSYRTAALATELGVPTSVVDEHLQQLARAGFVAATQAGGWVLSWDPVSATLHDLYRALDLPLAGSWAERQLASWQRDIAPAMDRIVRAEAAAMQVTLASLIAEIGTPAPVTTFPTGSRRSRGERAGPAGEEQRG
ncbi:MAG TPA: YihY family inner membrane protein [Stellaceae bacterium]|jgi:membrane protein|nr:YihY family inner membrane protein [Stellaceae bacterium]